MWRTADALNGDDGCIYCGYEKNISSPQNIVVSEIIKIVHTSCNKLQYVNYLHFDTKV